MLKLRRIVLAGGTVLLMLATLCGPALVPGRVAAEPGGEVEFGYECYCPDFFFICDRGDCPWLWTGEDGMCWGGEDDANCYPPLVGGPHPVGCFDHWEDCFWQQN